MQPIQQAVVNYSQMAIIEKYEAVIHYLYPIAQSLPRKHGVVRDMDDVVILGDDPEQLRQDFEKIKQFSQEKLKLTISKWQCASVKRGINFLGYRVWATHKLIRKDSVLRAKHKIKHFIEHHEFLNLTKFLASWRGHASWADTHNLFNWLDNKYDYANY